jgi:hypothetical protein
MHEDFARAFLRFSTAAAAVPALLLALFLALLLVFSGTAAAGPPFVTDDPGTAEAGSLEFRLGASAEFSEGENGLAAPEIEFAYGVTPRFEIAIGTALNHAFRTGLSTQTGVADLSVGAKWRLIEQGAGAPFALTVAPSFSAPTGSERKGFSGGAWAVRLPLVLGYETGGWSIAAETSWSSQLNGAGRAGEIWDAGLLVQRHIGERWTIGAEIHGEHERARGGVSAWVATIGAIVELDDGVAIMGNLGAGLDRDAPDATTTLVLQIVF